MKQEGPSLRKVPTQRLKRKIWEKKKNTKYGVLQADAPVVQTGRSFTTRHSISEQEFPDCDTNTCNGKVNSHLYSNKKNSEEEQLISFNIKFQ